MRRGQVAVLNCPGPQGPIRDGQVVQVVALQRRHVPHSLDGAALVSPPKLPFWQRQLSLCIGLLPACLHLMQAHALHQQGIADEIGGGMPENPCTYWRMGPERGCGDL